MKTLTLKIELNKEDIQACEYAIQKTRMLGESQLVDDDDIVTYLQDTISNYVCDLELPE